MLKSTTACVRQKAAAAAGHGKRANAAQARANLDAESAEYLANLEKINYDAAVA
jgi:hypothetical protein